MITFGFYEYDVNVGRKYIMDMSIYSSDGHFNLTSCLYLLINAISRQSRINAAYRFATNECKCFDHSTMTRCILTFNEGRVE